MMHISKEMLTDYYYKELEFTENSSVTTHLKQCTECQSQFASLNSELNFLNSLSEQKPNVNSYNNVILEIKRRETGIRFWKLFTIFTVIASLMMLLFYLNSEAILSIPFLKQLIEIDFFLNLDSLTKSLIVFLSFGTILSLAITPILIFEEEKTNEGYYHETT